jgi:putative SOS response-associated peptidase YedK
MCGRFTLATPIDDVAIMFDAEPLSDLTPFQPSWNIAPQAHVPVITQHGVNGEDGVPRHLRSMKWGLRPSWAKPSHQEPINARLESVLEKPMFRSSFQRRRCAVPADGWYEWMTTPQGKVPWYHHRTDGRCNLFAGIWDTWTTEEATVESFALLTRPANEDCEPVHHRMPVLVEQDELQAWLEGGEVPPLPKSGTVERYVVSREVNRTGEDHQGLIRRIPTLF